MTDRVVAVFALLRTRSVAVFELLSVDKPNEAVISEDGIEGGYNPGRFLAAHFFNGNGAPVRPLELNATLDKVPDEPSECTKKFAMVRSGAYLIYNVFPVSPAWTLLGYYFITDNLQLTGFRLPCHPRKRGAQRCACGHLPAPNARAEEHFFTTSDAGTAKHYGARTVYNL